MANYCILWAARPLILLYTSYSRIKSPLFFHEKSLGNFSTTGGLRFNHSAI